jgi:hypothetical protein
MFYVFLTTTIKKVEQSHNIPMEAQRGDDI